MDSDFDLLKKRLRDLVSCHKEINEALSADPVSGVGLLDLERIVSRVKEGENIPPPGMKSPAAVPVESLSKTTAEDES